MAKVSLRIYNREIERLIEQGNTDEAIAHCRHILTTFPKHLETYRLLGKAYLESRRYDEAVDIFGRLLMAVPDDFVAHVGLSIIRDEENKLDDAIWHMERAFEAQPSNPAIQGELQRLYGRRDGMEPPKIRMTRGALARIYMQGELYPQAVSEIRAVLSQDSQRADMQVLLALSYFKSGQKSDASDLCNQLLARYPYCFDANRIMVELIPATAGNIESTQVYRMRVGELDPYATFARASIFESAATPDASISLERLEYTGEEVSMGQDWGSSLGIGLGASAAPSLASSTDDQPDWLKMGMASDETPQDSSMPASGAGTGEEIPDFLRAAGWNEAQGPEQPTSIFDEEPAGETLVPADLPDWLKGQAPESPETPAQDTAPSIETPDWLEGLGKPDAAIDAGGVEESTESANAPDWLKGLDKPEETPQAAAEPAQPADIPDWLKGAEPKSEPSASAESLGASAQEQDDAVAWLESLAAKHGAKPEELVTDPNKRSETPPEWVKQARSAGEAQAPVEKKEEPSADWVEGAQNIGEQFFAEFEGASTSATDETGMWLRDLESKETQGEAGAPSAETESLPEWMTPTEEDQKLERGEIPEWLSDASQPAAEPQEETAQTSSDLPDWLGGMDQETAKETPAQESLGGQDLSDWLSSLDDETEKGSDAGAPVPSQPAEADLPGWLTEVELEKDVDSEKTPPASTPPTPAPVTLNVDLPEWLQGVDEESGEAEKSGEDAPPWLHREQWEADADAEAAPKPTAPSDWHPVVEKTEKEKTPPAREPSLMEKPPSPEPVEKPAAGKKKAVAKPARSRKSGEQSTSGMLSQAEAELDRGDIPTALLHYGKLIKKGKHLEETIRDLTDSLYRYPVEVSIWQTLGDAYMRANRLKEALDAYNKAEELIR
ncbi:MAG: hypothetical protein C4557_11700 [Anaerolineaceae bacterium]|nr:MAG: hypothetical protein C4557_11700 [Anaerolineaceae bacterium]